MQKGIVLATLVKLSLTGGGSPLAFRFGADAVELDRRLSFGQSWVKSPSLSLLEHTSLRLYRVEEYLPGVTLGVVRYETIIGLIKSIFAMKIDIVSGGKVVVKACGGIIAPHRAAPQEER